MANNKLSPFDYLNSINLTKKNLMDSPDPQTEKQYVPFVVNRSLSYFNDTVMFANEMNRLHHTPNKMQYDFHLNLIRKRKRFSKWAKKQDATNVELVKEFYGYSTPKAEEALKLLSADQIAELERRLYKGGK